MQNILPVAISKSCSVINNVSKENTTSDVDNEALLTAVEVCTCVVIYMHV